MALREVCVCALKTNAISALDSICIIVVLLLDGHKKKREKTVVSMAPLEEIKTNHTAHSGHRKQFVTTVLKDGDVPDGIDNMSADEAALTALGYKQEFKREFSLWTTFCVSFAVLGLLPSFASTLYYGMGYAGTGGMVWGWLSSWIFIQCVAMGMAELCSSMPTRFVNIGTTDLQCSWLTIR